MARTPVAPTRKNRSAVLPLADDYVDYGHSGYTEPSQTPPPPAEPSRFPGRVPVEWEDYVSTIDYAPVSGSYGGSSYNSYSGGSGGSGGGGGPAISPITAAQAQERRADEVDEENLSGVPLGDTRYSTREVKSNELVADHMEKLLDGDSRYITDARQRGAELSNRRGQFTSSLFGGASERAAIEGAMPIATADAQAYRDAATQNLAARNQNAIANIQRAAQLDSALLSSRTSISMANLDAATRVGIANMEALNSVNIANLNSETQQKITAMNNATSIAVQRMQNSLQIELQGRNAAHDMELAKFKHLGDIELRNLDGRLQFGLIEAGFQNNVVLADLGQQQQIELQSLINEYEIERQNRDHGFNDRQSHINMAMQAQVNYINYLASFAGTKMDKAAAARLQQQADQQLIATYKMINALYPNQPPIDVTFGKMG